MNRQERLKLLRAHHVLKEGATGEEVKKFLADIRGEKGDTGARGEKGLQGEKGLPGVPGRNGKDGLKGERGAKGLRGDRGEKGDTGQKGSKGLVWRSQWLNGVTYRVDDAVYSYGSAYICIREHKSANVNHPNTGDDWGTYWAILAERGETGPGGSQGPQGPAGPSGTGGSGGGIALAYDGNTAGVMATVSSGTAVVFGGNNVTLSQDGQSVTINGGAGGGGIGGFSAGTQLGTTGTLNFINSGGISWGLSQSSLLTGVVGAVRVVTAGNGSSMSDIKTLQYSNGNGVSFGLSTGVGIGTITGSVNTAYRNSTDALGLNTAGSNVTWTANSSGVSLDGRGYAGTGTTGTNATMTLNSNGLQLNAGAYLTTAMASNRGTDFVQATAGFNGTNVSGTIASNSISMSVAAQSVQTQNMVSIQGSTGDISFGNANGITFGGNNSTLTASVNTSYAASNHSHGNPTLNLTNLSGTTASASNGFTLSLSAPATSSLVASGNLTYSSAGSTITASVGNPHISRFEMNGGAISSISNGSVAQGSLSIQQMYVPLNVTASAFAIAGNLTMTTNTSATTASVNYSMNVGIYGLSGSTLSLLSSGSANNGFRWSQSASTTANTSVDGLRIMTAPINVNMTPGQYWVGVALSSATTYTGGTFSLHGDPSINTSASNAAFSPIGGATSNGGAIMFQGVYTAATNAMPASIVGSADINMTSASNVARANYYGRFYNATY